MLTVYTIVNTYLTLLAVFLFPVVLERYPYDESICLTNEVLHNFKEFTNM
jgi:hypothetical protein